VSGRFGLRQSSRFSRRMFEMTRPSGLMLIPNFITGVLDTVFDHSDDAITCLPVSKAS